MAATETKVLDIHGRVTAVGVTGNTTVTIPAGFAIKDIFVRNNTANAVMGGVKIGSTNGGTEVTVALAVGANAFTLTVPVVRQFSATVDTTLYIQAVVSFNSASLDIVFTLDRAIP